MTAGILLALALCALPVGALALVRNRLVGRRDRMRRAYAQIDAQLLRRYDVIDTLVEAVRDYLVHDDDALDRVIEARVAAHGCARDARRAPGRGAVVMALAQAEGVLDAWLGRMVALGEAYPELRASAAMRGLRDELISIENKVAFARLSYNDAVARYNAARAAFPARCCARVLGFSPACPFEVIEKPIERVTARAALS